MRSSSPWDPSVSDHFLSDQEYVEASQRDTKEDRIKVRDHTVAICANWDLYGTWTVWKRENSTVKGA